jgi:hypothetical protein
VTASSSDAAVTAPIVELRHSQPVTAFSSSLWTQVSNRVRCEV